MPIRRLEDTLTATTATIAGEDIAASSIPVKPHIQPGVLQPAVAGKLLNGANHSGAYGTAQTQSGGDGHSYYYTDIKGSKPIKDPRIGAHFGSQRYRFKSMQRLEQETAIHGVKVYSIDGRENIRFIGNWSYANASSGEYLNGSSSSFMFEVTGYFNDINLLELHRGGSTRGRWVVNVDGASAVITQTSNAVTPDSPLAGRYVDDMALRNFAIGSTLGIHTVKFTVNGDNNWVGGCELIAQDTGSTVRKQHVNIPAQNVVSYGKKFSIGSDTLTNTVHKHHNPFAFKTDGTTAWASGAHNGTSWPVGTGSSHNIDTATSLGLANWLHSSNYYKPYNGGRVVIWVASDGTIKTSVNVMPPNARSIANSASLTNATAKANASVANNTFYPTMEAGTIDHSLSEVAKAFYYREFGNGSANSNSSWKDWTYRGATHNFAAAYVMDDGLTSLSSDEMWTQVDTGNSFYVDDGHFSILTFIGTGFTFTGEHYGAGVHNIVQNLPYGTHIIKQTRVNAQDSGKNPDIWVDGILFDNVDTDTYGGFAEAIIHQPKKPPVPEDACILADYMLMADFVSATTHGMEIISKGVRFVNASRDFFSDGNAAWTLQHHPDQSTGGLRQYQNGSSKSIELPFFGSGMGFRYHAHSDRVANGTFKVDGSAFGSSHAEYDANKRFHTTNTAPWDTSANDGTFAHTATTNGSNAEERLGVKDITLGVHTFGMHDTTNTQYLISSGAEINSPIHTSSHYQTFETPLLKELVGGDRNMEQTNLVVTADGKTWDEVTRDTNYIGNECLSVRASANAVDSGWSTNQTDHLNVHRGVNNVLHMFNKDWAIGYDRYICLVDGEYEIKYLYLRDTTVGNASASIYVNGTVCNIDYTADANHRSGYCALPYQFKRGDYFWITGSVWSGYGCHLSITRISKNLN